MRNFQLLAVTQFLLSGTVSGLEQGIDCPTQATTTVFVPITIFVTTHPSATTLVADNAKPGNTERYSQASTSKKCSGPQPAVSQTASSTTEVSADATGPAGNDEFTTSAWPTTLATSVIPATQVTTSAVPTAQVATSTPSGEGATSDTTDNRPSPTDIPGSRPAGPLNGYTNAAYFTNWGIYGTNYQPQSLPASQLTHVLYAFADIGADGTVKSSDTYADLEKHYETDSWDDQGHNAYGVVKQLFLHKKNNRNMKTLLSIGGWTYSPKFVPVAASVTGRQIFASSAIQLMVDYGFDGVDIDWEYPSNPEEAQNFVLLLQAVRKALDDYSSQHSLNYRFLITVASPAGPMNYVKMDLAGMDKYVDSWHLMAYDYAGSWDATSGHQSNLFKDNNNPTATKFNTEDAVRYYESQGIASTKIILGMPLYGRSFEQTPGLGQDYDGVGAGGPEPGVWPYKSLPRPGAVEHWDDAAQASWSYDGGSRELVSYDNVRSAGAKTDYVLGRGLGGAFFWEASGDKAGDLSLIGTAAGNLRWLDGTLNNLRYPTSQYDNIRKGLE